MEGKFSCQCTQQLSVTPNAQTIRCHKCYATTSIKTNQHSSSIAVLPNNKPNLTGSSEARHSKRAVLCGVTYKKQRYKLKGPVNDVNSMRTLLLDRFKFPIDSIRVLTEEENDQYQIPTRYNIKNALKWLMEDCRSGDSLVFYFSGHGLRQPDFNRDELDGFDETICPVDFKTEGMILDNDINSTIVKPLKEGVTLHAIIDACHSGTVLDLPYVYNKEEEKWIDNRPPSGADKGTTGGLAIGFSACADDQKVADTSAFSGKTMMGAMTYTFIRAVNENPELTYGELLKSMHEAIKKANEPRHCKAQILTRLFHKKLLREPHLSSSETFDIFSKKFSL